MTMTSVDNATTDAGLIQSICDKDSTQKMKNEKILNLVESCKRIYAHIEEQRKSNEMNVSVSAVNGINAITTTSTSHKNQNETNAHANSVTRKLPVPPFPPPHYYQNYPYPSHALHYPYYHPYLYNNPPYPPQSASSPLPSSNSYYYPPPPAPPPQQQHTYSSHPEVPFSNTPMFANASLPPPHGSQNVNEKEERNDQCEYKYRYKNDEGYRRNNDKEERTTITTTRPRNGRKYEGKKNVDSNCSDEDEHLKTYYNFVKSLFLELYQTSNGRVLDLGCNVSDVIKYRFLKPNKVIFIDNNPLVLNKCESRWITLHPNDRYAASFKVMDFTWQHLDTEYKQYFDLVVCHCSLQYSASSKNTLTHFFQLVYGALRPGGIWLGIYPSGDAIISFLKKHNGHFTNNQCEIYKVIRKEEDDSDRTSNETQSNRTTTTHKKDINEIRFGDEYYIRVPPITTGCEYMVRENTFIDHLKIHNFELMMHCPLTDLGKEIKNSPVYERLYRYFKMRYARISDTDQDLLSLFRIFVAVK
jgi:hypothetical protein